MRALRLISLGLVVLLSLLVLSVAASAQGNEGADHVRQEGDCIIPGAIPEFRDAPYGINDAGSPESLRINEQAERYYALADDRQQAAAKSYYLIYSGTTHVHVKLGGKYFSPMDLENMTQEQRAQLAKAYLQENGYWEDYTTLQEEQDEFLAEQENADFAQYKQWQVAVFDYDGGPDVYWQHYLQRNPDNYQAKRYYESVRDANFLYADRDRGLTSLDAYMVTKGIRAGAFDTVPDVSWYQVIDPVGILNTPPQPSMLHRC